MTLRPEEIRILRSADDGRYAWHLRFKGVRGKGIYGSVVTDWQGRGLYLLAWGDYLGLPGFEQRLTCLVASCHFFIPMDSDPFEAREAIVEALLTLGWGPRVDATGRLLGTR